MTKRHEIVSTACDPPPHQAHLDGWFPGDVGHQAVHCNVLAVQLLVHKPADVLGQPVAVEVEVILQGRWEGEQEGEGE